MKKLTVLEGALSTKDRDGSPQVVTSFVGVHDGKPVLGYFSENGDGPRRIFAWNIPGRRPLDLLRLLDAREAFDELEVLNKRSVAHAWRSTVPRSQLGGAEQSARLQRDEESGLPDKILHCFVQGGLDLKKAGLDERLALRGVTLKLAA